MGHNKTITVIGALKTIPVAAQVGIKILVGDNKLAGGKIIILLDGPKIKVQHGKTQTILDGEIIPKTNHHLILIRKQL